MEGFDVDGRTYTYFGPWPSVLRLPVLLATDDLEGRLTAPSMLLAFVTTMAVTAGLYRRVREIVRGGRRGRPPPWSRIQLGVAGAFLLLRGRLERHVPRQPGLRVPRGRALGPGLHRPRPGRGAGLHPPTEPRHRAARRHGEHAGRALARLGGLRPAAGAAAPRRGPRRAARLPPAARPGRHPRGWLGVEPILGPAARSRRAGATGGLRRGQPGEVRRVALSALRPPGVLRHRPQPPKDARGQRRQPVQRRPRPHRTAPLRPTRPHRAPGPLALPHVLVAAGDRDRRRALRHRRRHDLPATIMPAFTLLALLGLLATFQRRSGRPHDLTPLRAPIRGRGGVAGHHDHRLHRPALHHRRPARGRAGVPGRAAHPSPPPRRPVGGG